MTLRSHKLQITHSYITTNFISFPYMWFNWSSRISLTRSRRIDGPLTIARYFIRRNDVCLETCVPNITELFVFWFVAHIYGWITYSCIEFKFDSLKGVLGGSLAIKIYLYLNYNTIDLMALSRTGRVNFIYWYITMPFIWKPNYLKKTPINQT